MAANVNKRKLLRNKAGLLHNKQIVLFLCCFCNFVGDYRSQNGIAASRDYSIILLYYFS